MSTLTQIFGTVNQRPEVPNQFSELIELWHVLSPQFKDDNCLPDEITELNNAMTQMKPEIVQLWALYQALQPKVVMEIGCSQGGTLASWCRLGRDDATIIALDLSPDDCWPYPGFPVHPSIWDGPLARTSGGGGMHCLKKPGSQQQIYPTHGMSYDPDTIRRVKEALAGRQIDFCFHDASHLRDMTIQDFDIYWPMIAPGGMMAFHDIAYWDEGPERVMKWAWWDEVRANLPHDMSFEWKSDGKKGASMGIGVIVKRMD